MSLIEMAQAFPDMNITIKAADLLAAFETTARKILQDAEQQHRRHERSAGCKLIEAEKVRQGLKVSTTTLWRWKRQGYLVPVKFGGKAYYRQEDIDDILQAHEEK